ncbi:MAG: response regulator, partial [bacterium]|nr:response regulator [bacterium]
HVMTAANRATELVKQILAFSRQSKRERTPLKLAAIVNETLNLLRSSLPSSIEILCNIKSDSASILADPTQMHQVLMNLCTNAAHAMRAHGGILKVTLRTISVEPDDTPLFRNITEGKYIELSVSDTGHGMERSVLDRIFDPYFTTKEMGEGTGLGLAVTHGIIKGYRGEISVYSEPGKGTTFFVYFPVIKESTGTVPAAEPDLPIQIGNERILLVDDEEDLVEMEKQMLTKLGYDVVAQTDSLRALELFRENPDSFDLVITDQTMPNLTGVQLTEAIRGIKPGVPIILCTGFSETIDEYNFKSQGISAYMLKPVLKKDMARIIREVLAN